jgi:hypothetical protein
MFMAYFRPELQIRSTADTSAKLAKTTNNNQQYTITPGGGNRTRQSRTRHAAPGRGTRAKAIGNQRFSGPKTTRSPAKPTGQPGGLHFRPPFIRTAQAKRKKPELRVKPSGPRQFNYIKLASKQELPKIH